MTGVGIMAMVPSALRMPLVMVMLVRMVLRMVIVMCMAMIVLVLRVCGHHGPPSASSHTLRGYWGKGRARGFTAASFAAHHPLSEKCPVW